jgi:hypothetical protein
MCFPVARRSSALCLALILTSAGASAEPSAAPAFCADIVSRDAAGAAVGTAARLYVANRRVRIETSAPTDGFFVIDGEAGTALFVQPAQRIFMDARQSSRLTQLFVPVDTHDPCRQWQAAAKNAGVPSSGSDWRCQRIDTAIPDNSGTFEYRVLSPDPSQRWIDPILEFPVKLRAADGTTIALEHIRVEAQPASLFAIPPGYRKFDPQALIERIKHSDVWVGHTSP